MLCPISVVLFVQCYYKNSIITTKLSIEVSLKSNKYRIASDRHINKCIINIFLILKWTNHGSEMRISAVIGRFLTTLICLADASYKN